MRLTKLPILCILLLLCPFKGAFAAQAIVYARDYYDPELPTCGIQEAISSLPTEGGRVILEAQTYVMRAPIVLRNDLVISGQGSGTVLTRPAEIIHRLTEDLAQREQTVVLESTEGLRVGDRISIRDDSNGGWYLTPGVITEIEGNSIKIDHPSVRDYAVERNAIVLNHHPMIEAYRIWDYRWHIKRFVIEDITIDGNLEENPTPISDWATTAIHLASAAEGIVQRCVVRNWITDGISDQYGRFNTIRDNVIENCRGNGFHPGTSVRGSRFINNIARNNQGDGLFFCADVTGIQVLNNTFAGNKRNGIGGLGGGGDTFNVVSGNICYENARNGIEIENGNGNIVTGNICYDNSTSEPGRYAGILIHNSTETTVTNNVSGSKLNRNKQPTQGYGIIETGTSNRNVVTGNVLRANMSAGLITIGAETAASNNMVHEIPQTTAE